jgi:uncharacterized protein YbgA (DUF1722 family)/uncharacterized protein YbbK (DUF523 family)
MLDYPKPNLIMSACLNFEACRYNGAIIKDQWTARLMKHCETTPICPEKEAGMGVPRKPVSLYEGIEGDRMIQHGTGKEYTKPMNEFADSFLSGLSGVDGFVLKAKSPSCGVFSAKLFDDPDKKMPVKKTAGLFAQKVLKGYHGFPIEEEGRLNDDNIREHFFTRLFMQARFRELARDKQVKDLIKFHAQHKLILMAYNQVAMREMGKILGSFKRGAEEKLFKAYGELLMRAMSKQARFTSHLNIVHHAMGYFKKGLSAPEKKHLLDLVEQYVRKELPLSAIKTVLRSWIARFDNEYLADQYYFEPYPRDLLA